MSKFIKGLEEASRGSIQPIGFGRQAKPSQASLMLIAQLNRPDSEMASLALSARVDALLLDYAKDFSDVSSLGKEIPWGVQLRSGGEVDELANLGCDYVIFDCHMIASVAREEKLGKILKVDLSLSHDLARAIRELPFINALLIADEAQGESWTINKLLSYKRLIGLAGRPALTSFPKDARDLEVLMEVGIRGVMVEVTGKESEEKLIEAKKAIQKLPPKPKSRERISAVLPLTTPSRGEEEEI